MLFRPVLSQSLHKPPYVVGDLLREIQYWRFLDNWQGCLPWFDERHVVISTFSDASNSGWGGVFSEKSGSSVQVRDYWSSVDSFQPIIIREALALKNTLRAGAASLAAFRVDAHVDSLPLVRGSYWSYWNSTWELNLTPSGVKFNSRRS